MDKIKIKTPWVREFLSEFMGTFILMMVGNSAMAQHILKNNSDLFGLTFSWGVAVMLGMLVGASNSGGHVNPMVTISLASVGKFPWVKVPHYAAGQFLGAFVSCPLLYLNNREMMNHFDNGTRVTIGEGASAKLWTTFPESYVSWPTCVLDTIICCAVIMYCILAILDKHNANVPGYLHSFYVALLVMTVVWTMGSNCMCAINPARDFSPRIFAVMIGYTEAFSYMNFWWIPLFVPPVGGAIGSVLYELTISNHIPAKQSAPLAEIKEMDEFKKEEAKPMV